ncbi:MULTISPECIES: four helix bundle protein [unclassified Pseudomonas]|uniref:four helix bundle protein n=1 Tax=unclassified Pseudomonas TaxID=196821 RepID=UPI0002A424FE|nr:MULTISPECIES: four helix bundle protein [unclassified Pseudomonas]NTX88146.1 four helix bundle protein [Pseudomonas sp. UMA643]NTY18719.1 four helix bundle protein [Pseudomonas sp. UMC3103]NTY23977.1 four helix bundle protein [Pseudomonas sp. UMA603]NTY29176.1 four helix bundle protein [Pseudomonas sp. UMC3129]NTY53376.1 four helix bundle protein [Pseudomonas sp. UMC631]NTY65738.1 four helix bundle protein [Pseudomonas sp. UMC3106]NUA33748.1 four helix bundle protein [Pseudomonas sp. UMA6
MALHTELEIHRSAEELLGVVLALVRHIPRDMKQLIGGKLRDESLQVMVLIGRANMARNKRQHLDQLLESIWMINHLLRTMVNQHFISVAQHAKAMRLTASIGRQANAWKKATATAPVA